MDLDEEPLLPYDEVEAAAQEEERQRTPIDSEENGSTEGTSTLAKRIGGNRLYLLSDSTAALHGRLGKALAGGRLGKRKAEAAQLSDIDEDIDVDAPNSAETRSNALLLHGDPIAHLPTNRLFAFTAHFDVKPMGLEWVDDTTCVLVFDTPALARSAYAALTKLGDSETAPPPPDEDGFIDARTVPVTLWPMEERLSKALGKSDGLKGTIRMRWAKIGDVKKRGAKSHSEFYKKHGENAGKEGHDPYGILQNQHKRRKRDPDSIIEDDEEAKRRLDAELDSFLDDRENGTNGGRADIIDTRPSAPTPRKARRVGGTGKVGRDRQGGGGGGGRGGRRGGGGRREQPSKDSLDDELDRFLQDRSGGGVEQES